MANKLDPIDLKQIITLHNNDVSNRSIGKHLGISRNTVNSYIRLISASSYSLNELLVMDNAKLEDLFTAHTTIKNERFNELTTYFDKVNTACNHLEFTFLYHYNSQNMIIYEVLRLINNISY